MEVEKRHVGGAAERGRGFLFLLVMSSAFMEWECERELEYTTETFSSSEGGPERGEEWVSEKEIYDNCSQESESREIDFQKNDMREN